MEKLNILAIKTNLGYYYTETNWNYNFDNYYINGNKQVKSFKHQWYFIKDVIKSIQKKNPEKHINKRFVLIDKELKSKFQMEYKYEDIYDDEYKMLEFFKSIQGLYKLEYDIEKEEFVDLNFEYTELLELEQFVEPKGIQYKVCSGNYGGKINLKTSFPIERRLISEIMSPPIVAHLEPQKLSAQDSYEIIRAYVKENIDSKVASITSDYDFCFTVQKIIPLAKPYTYQIDTSIGKRKPKYETRTKINKNEIIYQIAPKAYDKYPIVTPFEGDNEEHLKSVIDEYLKNLMIIINTPICECVNCNGTGYIYKV